MSSPYGAVTQRARLLPEGVRCTAYWYASRHGLPVTFSYLLELGLRAARAARWLGLQQAMVREGYPDNPLWVHTWPEWIWERAAGAGAPCPPAPVPVPQQRPTRVVHCRREPYDVLIDRTTAWGNPYIVGRDGSREQVITRYEAYLRSRPELLARLGELRGRVLGCHCAPAPCHGDVLAWYADAPPVPASPPPPPPEYRYRHQGDPAWESADGDPEGYGDPQPERRLTAWQFAEEAQALCGDGDEAFVAELDSSAAYVAAKRGVPWEPHWDWDREVQGDARVHSAWPESLWRDVYGAHAQASAERGETELGEDELDAVAEGLFPDPEYRPGGKPSPAQFMVRYGEPLRDDFWSFAPPPEDTQAYVDWMAMADEDMRWRDDPYASSAWHEPWPPRYEARDAGWGEGGVPWDGDDIRPYG